jgi:hypothetical protein
MVAARPERKAEFAVLSTTPGQCRVCSSRQLTMRAIIIPFVQTRERIDGGNKRESTPGDACASEIFWKGE